MTADDLLQRLTEAPFVLIFLAVLLRTWQHPRRVNVDTALLFGAVTAAVVAGWVAAARAVDPKHHGLSVFSGSLIMALPYLQLRLVEDFADVPSLLVRAAEAGLALAVAGLVVFPTPLPGWLTLPYVVYFFALEVYAAVMFVREARRSSGVTRRRMQAVAAGSLFLGLVILTAGFQAAVPRLELLWGAVTRICGLTSGLAYFLGFAPPGWLRRAWQEPELRAFLGRAARLPRLPDTAAIVSELERGAAGALGAPHALISLWDEDARVLRTSVDGEQFEYPAGEMIGGRTFASQRPVLSLNAARDDPDHAEMYRAYGSNAILAAPITAEPKRLGVLMVYAPRAPVFAEDDLVLVQLLADQAAVILESRALIDAATRVRAREEAARLKDDFLSSAAHDLKTPLTTLVAQAQLLERRAQRHPEAPVDLAGVQRLVREANRLNLLVRDLLDASRLERGVLVQEREPVDLVELVREVCERHDSERHPCRVEASGPVVGVYDRVRIAQVLENLVENAIKYSPAGGDVEVRVWREDEVHLSVTDHGIGIPAADLLHVFDRFHRGANVDDRRFSGMGLGLYICREIARQHGGDIEVNSVPGRGTTFTVTLPVTAAEPVGAGGRAHE